MWNCLKQRLFEKEGGNWQKGRRSHSQNRRFGTVVDRPRVLSVGAATLIQRVFVRLPPRDERDCRRRQRAVSETQYCHSSESASFLTNESCRSSIYLQTTDRRPSGIDGVNPDQPHQRDPTRTTPDQHGLTTDQHGLTK